MRTTSYRTIDGERFDFVYDVPFNLNVFAKQRTLKRGPKTHFASVNLSWRSGLPYILSGEMYPETGINDRWTQGIPNNSLYPNTRLPNYFRIDLNYSMEKLLKKGGKRVWQFSVLNATNHFNPYIVYIKRDSEGVYKKHEAQSLIPTIPSVSFKRYW